MKTISWIKIEPGCKMPKECETVVVCGITNLGIAKSQNSFFSDGKWRTNLPFFGEPLRFTPLYYHHFLEMPIELYTEASKKAKQIYGDIKEDDADIINDFGDIDSMPIPEIDEL